MLLQESSSNTYASHGDSAFQDGVGGSSSDSQD
jgi:hypothetical protein